jgi:hypothetical protein
MKPAAIATMEEKFCLVFSHLTATNRNERVDHLLSNVGCASRQLLKLLAEGVTGVKLME